jgi:hypothetical protein
MIVRTHVTNGQRSPQGWADICVKKVITISDDAHPALREQAHAFRTRIEQVVANYIRMAVEEERAFTATFLEQHGASELASAVRSR